MKLSELTLEQYATVEKKYRSYIYNCTGRKLQPVSFEAWYWNKIEQGKIPYEDIRAQRQANHYSKLRFHRHRAQAKYRNIPFEFSWEQWHQWWLNHGYDRNQPNAERGADRMCMCRYGDTGPYSPENVYLASIAENNSDAKQNGRRRGGRPKGSKNRPKG